MSVRIVRLGSPRSPGEGLRIGTVRRPPRGVPASRFAADDWYDVWYPVLAPSPETVKLGLAARTDREWRAYARRYLAEMAAPAASRTLDLLAALSHTTRFSVGCYCEDEARCHRSLLRELLARRGARIDPAARQVERGRSRRGVTRAPLSAPASPARARARSPTPPRPR